MNKEITKTKVIIVGLEGAAFDILKPLIDQARFFKRVTKTKISLEDIPVRLKRQEK